jgi:hypothetical protein
MSECLTRRHDVIEDCASIHSPWTIVRIGEAAVMKRHLRTAPSTKEYTMKDQDAKQIDRANEIRDDAAKQAGKQINKADEKFAKADQNAAEDRAKGYEKAAKESDRADANKDMNKADNAFVKDETKAIKDQEKGYDKAAQVLGEKAEAKAKNRDPITDAPGSHPVGTGVGTLGGAAAGAAAGALAGPVGMAVGGLVGAIVGAAAGHSAGEAISPTVEEAFWRSAYGKEPYFNNKYTFDDYAPAYRAGFMGRDEYRDLSWEKAEPRLASDWEKNRGSSRLQWDQARDASRAAWQRVDRSGS